MSAHQQSPILPWNKGLWHQLLNNQQLPQAILLSGSKGLGKRQFVTRFSAHILDNDDVFYNGNHPDFHVLKTESECVDAEDLLPKYARRYLSFSEKRKPKSIISVQQIRDLIYQVNQHPQMSEYKVVLIDGADQMNVNAANALLKTLEEPNASTLFLLVSDYLHKIPVTIRSRCVIHKMRAPSFEFGMEWLGQQSDNSQLESYLAMSSGAPLKALEMARSDYISQVREVFTPLNQLWSKKITVVQAAKKWNELPFDEVLGCLHKLLLDICRLNQCYFQGQDPSQVKSKNASDDDTTTDTHESNALLLSLYFPAQIEWIKKIVKRVEITEVFSLIDNVNNRKKISNVALDTTLSLEELAINFDKLI